mgnify:CR=1 FL=1
MKLHKELFKNKERILTLMSIFIENQLEMKDDLSLFTAVDTVGFIRETFEFYLSKQEVVWFISAFYAPVFENENPDIEKLKVALNAISDEEIKNLLKLQGVSCIR